jgi:hypothetical protein
MTPEIEKKFVELKEKYGRDSVQRVEWMLDPRKVDRAPLQNSRYVMPGLSKKGWHDPYDYPDFARIARGWEEHHPAIRNEIVSFCDEQNEKLEKYKHYFNVEDENWRSIYLHQGGRYVEENRPVSPVAFDYMINGVGDWLCPLLECHYSIFLRKVVLAPHCGLWNFSINMHLAIEIPEECGIRVVGETRQWTEGKTLVFDYSFEHDAWSLSGKRRICLVMDLWHPEVTLPEREALVFVMREIRRIMGQPM